MPDPIFVQPDHDYDSYIDLWRIVELSGYTTIRESKMDQYSDNVYILSGPGVPSAHHGWPDAKARIIYFNLEWYEAAAYVDMPGVELWSTDKWHAQTIGAKYVPMGSHPGLPDAPLQNTAKIYDAAMMAYLPPRREQIVYSCGLFGVSLAPRGWDMERHAILQQSKAMLHVHQHDYAHTIAPQRWALAAAYKLPVISETVNDKGVFTHGLYADYEYLAEFMKLWRDDPNLIDFGLALNDLLCVRRPFRSWIDEAL